MASHNKSFDDVPREHSPTQSQDDNKIMWQKSVKVVLDALIQTSGLGFDEMRRLPEAKPGSNLFNSTLVEAKHISLSYPALLSLAHTPQWLVERPRCTKQPARGGRVHKSM